MKKSPCKNCLDRHVGCHNEQCPHGWYEWDRQHRELKDRIWKEKQIGWSERKNGNKER